MEELLAVLGFGAGASLTIGATRLLRRGLRPIAIGVTRAGMSVGYSLRRIGEEARAELRRPEPAEAAPVRRARRPRAQNDRTIEIATS